jgi:hypothetical protein
MRTSASDCWTIAIYECTALVRESGSLAAPVPKAHPPNAATPPPPNPDRRRALELLASCRDGCTEAIMLAHGFSIDMMVELVNAGLASATAERVIAGGKTIEVARVRTTEPGRQSFPELRVMNSWYWISGGRRARADGLAGKSRSARTKARASMISSMNEPHHG